eukprot:5273727-Pleurochrysis_carterae.AAC.1
MVVVGHAAVFPLVRLFRPNHLTFFSFFWPQEELNSDDDEDALNSADDDDDVIDAQRAAKPQNMVSERPAPASPSPPNVADAHDDMRI